MTKWMAERCWTPYEASVAASSSCLLVKRRRRIDERKTYQGLRNEGSTSYLNKWEERDAAEYFERILNLASPQASQ
ncbi:hypothetical protein CRUP_016498, partial [Coryphaenoides rupestris]